MNKRINDVYNFFQNVLYQCFCVLFLVISLMPAEEISGMFLFGRLCWKCSFMYFCHGIFIGITNEG